MATLFKADGTAKDVHPSNGKTFSQNELCDYVCGLPQVIDLKNDSLMIINEDGEMLDLSVNQIASISIQANGINDIVLGDALVCNINEIN